MPNGTESFSQHCLHLPELQLPGTSQSCSCGLLDAVTGSMPDLIYIKDAQCRYVYSNTAHLRFLGVTDATQLRGKSVLDLFPPELGEKFYRDERRVIETGRPMIAQEELTIDHDGQPRWVSTTKVALRDLDGRIIGLVGISRDITETKQAEQELRRAHDALEAKHDQLIHVLEELRRANDCLDEAHMQLAEVDKLQSLTTIAAGIAHDVKSPLSIISLGLEYLRSRLPEPPDDTTEIVLRNLATAVHKAGEVIHGLLDFSSPQRFRLTTGSMNPIVEKALGMARFQLIRRKTSLAVELQPDLPPMNLDQQKVEQGVMNLLNNAIHAMGSPGHLTVRTRRVDSIPPAPAAMAQTTPPASNGDGLVLVEIEDSGPGIPPEVLARLFHPFFTTKREGEGTGLGLSVVKWIMEAHRGMVRIANGEQGGVCATLVFPIIPHEDDGGDHGDNPQNPAGR